MPVKINTRGKKSISASIKARAEAATEPQVREYLENIGDYATSISPVWSGAYVKSFSFVPAGSGAGRMRKSKIEEDNRESRSQIISEAQGNLRSDLANIDLSEVRGIVLRNRSPHSREVEYGPTPQNPAGYAVFARVKDKFR